MTQTGASGYAPVGRSEAIGTFQRLVAKADLEGCVRRDIIVAGASAGGVEALRTLVAGLPADLPAAVLVVLHIPPYGAGALPAILSRSGPLPARHPRPYEPISPGVVYVASPDHHLLVQDGTLLLNRGPRENGYRPAVDVLFRTAARAHGARVVGVVLSGARDDGTAGLAAIAARGGTTVVQDPSDALYPGMPQNALDNLAVDHVAPAEELGQLLVQLCHEDVADSDAELPPLMELETEMAMMTETVTEQPDHPGHPSGYSCPDCSGVLWELTDGELVRYRCRVGHAWSAEGLLDQQSEQLDTALWMALRSLEERAALSRTLAERAAERGSTLSEGRFREQSAEAAKAATVLRQMLDAHVGTPAESPAR